jgi:endonuclease/exonuclease/phosphatase (EEP) superfamily protein YafD
LVVIPAVLLAAASLAAFAGRWVWWLDVMANFRAQYVVALVVLGFALLGPRWRKFGYGVLAAAAVNLAVVAPLYLGSPGPADPALPSIRVISFNLLSTNEDYAEVIEFIEVADADLVFLHEASRPWEIAIESAALGYEIVRPRAENLIFGTLVLARDEVDAVSYGFAATQPRAVALAYRPEGWPVPVHVLSTHPLAPTSQERAALRDAQLEFARDWAISAEGAYLVVGDLNATPWSAPFRRLLRGSGLGNSLIGFGLQPSFPAESSVLLRVPIDHLLHSEKMVVRDRRLGPDLGSDHFPLIVDLQYSP